MRHTIILRNCVLAASALFAFTVAAAEHGDPAPFRLWKQPSQVRLAVVDRDTGAELPQYHHRGQVYVAGRPGARYLIRLGNQAAERVLTVVSVDGVNVVTGKTASFGDSGYVLHAGSTHEINGWRKSDREVAAFEFAALADSYAARTGRPANVGVIGVAVFKEKQHYAPPADYRTLNAPSSPSASRMESSKAMPPGGAGLAARDSLGTGHGEREVSVVSKTTFDRASQSPSLTLTIRYDRYENLMAAGIIPKVRAYPYGPNPFPAEAEPGYAPDPPPRRWR